MNTFRDLMTSMRLEWINEDELPEVPQEVYDAMFKTSIVNGVRYFPYMKGIDGTKFYLVFLEEK